MTEIKQENNFLMLCGVMFIALIAIFIPELVNAADHSKALQGPYDSFKAILDGYGAKIITLTALAVGIIGCVLRFNALIILGAFGTAILATKASSIVELLVG